jgi:hypothetical protein
MKKQHLASDSTKSRTSQTTGRTLDREYGMFRDANGRLIDSDKNNPSGGAFRQVEGEGSMRD